MLEGEMANSTTVAPMSPVGSTSSARAIMPTTALIQQQRDELDPAPHHTAAEIRVLEILKRIRDSGGVREDANLGVSQPKRKSGRTKTNRTSHTQQIPTHLLPQPRPMSIASATVPAAKLSIDPFNTPSYSLSDSIYVRPTTAVTVPVRLQNGTIAPPPFPATLLAAKNSTAGIVVNTTTAAAMVRQRPPMTPTGTQQTAIELELILPNGLGIPVSATCAELDLKTHSAATAMASTCVSSPLAATNTLSSRMPLSEVPTPANASQPICSCSRSKCLKLCCNCFAAGKACGDGCSCRHCYNNLADDITKRTRDFAVRTGLARNPLAFKRKIENTNKRAQGCRCKRSHCLKGYCDCYLARIPCNQRCRCLGCSNDETTGTDSTAAGIICTNAAPDTTNNTVMISKPMDEIHMPLLAFLTARQQFASTADSGSTSATTPAIASTVPQAIKALTPTNGTDGMVVHRTGSLTGLSPFLHPSHLAAAAPVAVRSTSSAQQDLPKCLQSSPVPSSNPTQFPLQSRAPDIIIPCVLPMTMVTDGLVDASVPITTALISKLSPLLSATIKAELNREEETDNVSNAATALTSEPSPPREFIIDSCDQQDVGISDEEEEEGMMKEEDYSGYTEEELAFMQCLQQDRKAVVASVTDVSQF